MELDLESQCWLFFSLLKGVGPRKISRLLSEFSTLTEVVNADRSRLRQLGLNSEQISAVDDFVCAREPELYRQHRDRIQTWLQHPLNTLLHQKHPDYPAQLLQIYDAPLVLFAVGDCTRLMLPQLAMVGSRRASPAGLDAAYHFARELSRGGITITSGFAYGIDTRAHQGALLGSGGTIAVLGTGADVCYPAQNRKLFDTLPENGVIVSEFPLGTAPQARQFPKRNRLISGLAAGVLVVEASLKSGSLITARTALEQNREVFALPGSIQNPMAKGCHQLIKQGAKLVDDVYDILDNWQSLFSFQIQLCQSRPLARIESDHSAAPKLESTPAKSQGDLTEREQALLNVMGYDIEIPDQLIARASAPAHEVMQDLVMLELKDYIESVSGGYRKRM
ncbi:MAG: DNA-processing protein DprA [Pseudomonadales bacterium]|nr:DNA-processing protein DprA [Pseudomonadales bacterium]